MYVNEGTFSRLKETASNAIVERDKLKAENCKLRELVGDMMKMLALASWTSVESDEQAS